MQLIIDFDELFLVKKRNHAFHLEKKNAFIIKTNL